MHYQVIDITSKTCLVELYGPSISSARVRVFMACDYIVQCDLWRDAVCENNQHQDCSNARYDGSPYQENCHNVARYFKYSKMDG